ncbi:MAG: hypothetical protein ACXAC7_02675 [Candidatus Hodarchaeales archaeon]|jgi:hypothetical protein
MNTDYVERFGYRPYSGKIESRWKRIWNLAWFEIVSTWHKSTIGKIFLIFLIVINFLMSLGAVSEAERQGIELIEFLGLFVGSYFRINGINGIGIFIIPVIAIAGSGYFADDKQGNLIEVYMARLTREEYALGKILGMFLYTNILTTIPLFSFCVLYIHGFGGDHISLLGFYLSVITFGSLFSLILTLFFLLLSSLVDKRAYAGLSGFLIYIMGSLINFGTDENEFLVLLRPSDFLSLLGHSIVGYNEVSLYADDPLIILNDGIGLESIHVFGLVIVLISVLLFSLLFKIHRITTEEI